MAFLVNPIIWQFSLLIKYFHIRNFYLLADINSTAKNTEKPVKKITYGV